MNICVYGASSNEIAPCYLEAGEKLGYEIAYRRHDLIFGGGDTGLMGAVARGVHSGGGKVIGIVPRFFRVDGILYPHCDDILYTDTMRQRKEMMEQYADAFLITPGGIGTLDEFFEIFTLRQLDRHRKPIAMLDTNGYYQPIAQLLSHMADEKFLTADCLKLLKISPDPIELLDFLQNNPTESISGTGLKFLEEDTV
ncbi:MAG: TIGR00730 family Rossman fold protein [Ruminococcaceae bacterium]|nr:TIGR00730 family Rossman fold protein [Oscillospiraceae bacterium]